MVQINEEISPPHQLACSCENFSELEMDDFTFQTA